MSKKITLFGLFGVVFILLLSLGIVLPSSQDKADVADFTADFEDRTSPNTVVPFFAVQDTNTEQQVKEIREITEVIRDGETTRTVKITKFETETKATASRNMPLLQRTDSGDTVEQLQTLLNENGADIEVDGIFGEETREAVIDYQIENGLLVDGFVGDQTWGDLLDDEPTGISNTSDGGITPDN
jgi:murein L,D-transpeptidase YcbB/YkuD